MTAEACLAGRGGNGKTPHGGKTPAPARRSAASVPGVGARAEEVARPRRARRSDVRVGIGVRQLLYTIDSAGCHELWQRRHTAAAAPPTADTGADTGAADPQRERATSA